ncbi:MAG: hypothetical protein MJ252_17625 [archaeon]|nr:hypothetical protein [archaeon]
MKSKKKKATTMKVTVKTEDERGLEWELQMKKKILQDRLSKNNKII